MAQRYIFSAIDMHIKYFINILAIISRDKLAPNIDKEYFLI